MNILPQNVQKMIQLLERLPGLGPKSAARIAMALLRFPGEYSKELGDLIGNLKSEIVHCKTCFNIASDDPCEVCSDERRDKSILCVVEGPLDVLAFESGAEYSGLYHVLGGNISPVNGIGPEDLTISQLINRIKKGEVEEVILATNPDIEGEATAMYIRQEIRNSKFEIPDKSETRNPKSEKKEIKVTRLARGLPSGADLEYADKTTIQKAFEGRTTF
jgi:recombination protein RecR